MFGLTQAKVLCVHLLVTLYITTVNAGPQCLACDDVASTKECGHVITCGDHEECYVQRFIASNLRQYYKMGCIDKNVCANSQSALYGFGFMGMVGKRDAQTSSSAHARHSRDVDEDMVLCLECCTGDNCNVGLCGSPPSQFLRCFDCQGILKPNDCDRISECGQDELCYVHIMPNHVTYELRYNLECKSKRICDAFGYTYNNLGCTTCCDSEYCNYGACANWTWSGNTGTQGGTTQQLVTSGSPILVPTHPPTTAPPAPTPPPSTTTTTHLPPPVVRITGVKSGSYKQRLSLQCTSDRIGGVYTWLYNGSVTLPADTHGYTSGKLDLAVLDESTRGQYTCLVIVNGVTGSDTATVTIVEEAPHNISFQHSLSNGVLSFRCVAGGYPIPSYDWSFEAVTMTHLASSMEFSGDRTSAVVNNYEPSKHDGNYKCKATNPLGTKSAVTSVP